MTFSPGGSLKCYLILLFDKADTTVTVLHNMYSLPKVVRVHMADVDEICCTQSVQGVCWRLMEKPPASGECRTLQPRVKHKPPLSKLQLHAGVG